MDILGFTAVANMPGFNAGASLYKTSGHYRTDRYNLSTETASPIRPSAEVIEINDCNPGFIKLGEWPNMTCIPDPNITGGDDQGEGPPDGEPTTGGKRPPKPTPAPKGSKKCTGESTSDQAALNCESKNRTEPIDQSEFVYRPLCTSKGKVNWCCLVRRKNNSYEHCEEIPQGKIDLGGGIPLGGAIPLGGGI